MLYYAIILYDTTVQCGPPKAETLYFTVFYDVRQEQKSVIQVVKTLRILHFSIKMVQSRKSTKNSQKEGYHHLPNDPRSDFSSGSPQWPPSRARGILDKSSNETIKNRLVDLWIR